MDFSNSTHLDSTRMQQLFVDHTWPYRHDQLVVRVRYSRGADFSGTCYYRDGRIFVNLGKHTLFPYSLLTHLARAETTPTGWQRDAFALQLSDPMQLVLFVYLHELYHYLVKMAGRSPKRKEAMCDRFAARALVDDYNIPVIDGRGHPVARAAWDFQDLHQFVSRAPRVAPVTARREAQAPSAARREIPVRILDSK